MGFKKYFIFSVILIVATFGFAYGLELGEYELSLFGYSLLLPVSVWLILPISLLAVASMAHILWYGVINYFRKRAIEKDYETIIKMIKSDLLEKNEEYKFKTTEFKNLSSIISQLKIDTKENRFLSVDDELNRVVANVQDVKDGVIVTRIAAHAADIVKNVPGAKNWDLNMAKARKKLDWEEQMNLAIDPQTARQRRASRNPEGTTACSMCGDYCAVEIVNKYLGATIEHC